MHINRPMVTQTSMRSGPCTHRCTHCPYIWSTANVAPHSQRETTTQVRKRLTKRRTWTVQFFLHTTMLIITLDCPRVPKLIRISLLDFSTCKRDSQKLRMIMTKSRSLQQKNIIGFVIYNLEWQNGASYRKWSGKSLKELHQSLHIQGLLSTKEKKNM